MDVNELFSKLLKTGILKLSQPDSATTRKYGSVIHLHKALLSYKDVRYDTMMCSMLKFPTMLNS